MTTIKKKSYQPPIAEVLYFDNVLPLLAGSTIGVTIEDDNVDITDQDAPMISDLDF